MNKEEFLTNMQDVLQTEEDLNYETVLEDLDEWDSLSVMATMAFLEKKASSTNTTAAQAPDMSSVMRSMLKADWI